MRMFEDVGNQLLLRVKLFCKDRATMLVFLLSAACFLFCMADFNFEAKEKAGIPIGIENLEQPGEKKERGGQELVERLKRQPAIVVTEGSYEELERKMLDGYLRCILVIPEDYSERIRKGKVKKLIAAYHEEGDHVASLITDIMAGEMMYDVCLARGYETYEGLPAMENAKKFTREEYYAFAAMRIGDDAFDFAFEFHYLDNGTGQKGRKMENSLFYRQAVAAAAALLLTLLPFTATSGVLLEKEQGIAARRRLLAAKKILPALGNAIGCLLAEGVFSMLLSAIFAACVSAGTARMELFLPIFWTSVLFSAMMALIYYIVALAAPNLFAYQAIGAAFLLLFGAAGFLSMVEGAFVRGLPAWFSWIPNCMYLDCFVRILS